MYVLVISHRERERPYRVMVMKTRRDRSTTSRTHKVDGRCEVPRAWWGYEERAADRPVISPTSAYLLVAKVRHR